MDYLIEAIRAGATDLHVSSSVGAAIRVNGVFQRLGDAGTDEALRALAHRYLPVGFLSALQTKDQNVAITVNQVRCRVHGYLADGSPHLACRILASRPPDLATLHLPGAAISLLEDMDAGLFLIGGPTGVGKTTILGSWIQHTNTCKACHLITLEDPIEWLFTPNQAQIDQREIGRDVVSFEAGVLSALRADADALVIGELRTPEAVDAAVLAAETGHCVLATVHGEDAVHVLSRLTAGRSGRDRIWFLHRLAAVLRGILSLRMLPVNDLVKTELSADRNLNLELLVVNQPVRHLIESGEFRHLETQLQTGKQFGMMTFAQHRTMMTTVETVESGMKRPVGEYE